MNAPPPPVRLHLLLPVHNRRATTLACVAALARQTHRDFRLILLDDGSTDGTAGAVRAQWPAVEVVTGPGDWWWAGALAQGCRHLQRTGVAGDDVVGFLNDDVEFAPDFLARALAELAAQPGTLLLARQTDARSGAEIDRGGGVHADLRHLRFAPAAAEAAINCLPTRGLFLRWRDYERTGGFVPHALPHYLSDYEFTIRAGRRGLRLRVARDAVLQVRLEQSGRSLANLTAVPRTQRWRLVFSERFKDNPVTWSVFAWLVAPRARLPWLWLKIWAHFAVVTVPSLFAPARE